VVTHLDASSSDSGPVAVKAVLGIAGLSWTESSALLAAHPDLFDEPAHAEEAA
jgi:hypothetical protein